MNISNVYLSTIDINERERELFLYIKSWQQCFSASSKSVMSDKAQLYADFLKVATPASMLVIKGEFKFHLKFDLHSSLQLIQLMDTCSVTSIQ